MRLSATVFLIVISIFFMPICLAWGDIPYRAAVFHDSRVPAFVGTTDVEIIQTALQEMQIPYTVLDADQMADAKQLDLEQWDLLIVPTGAAFPAEAKSSLLNFLSMGGDLFCTGGYAFDDLYIKQNNEWTPYENYFKQEKEKARNPKYSLVLNGGLENDSRNWNTVAPAQCAIDKSVFFSGAASARVVNSATGSGARWEQELPVKPGESYLIGAQVKTDDIQGSGYGYLAVYQYDAQGQLLHFIDFAQFWQPQDWKRHEFQVDIVPQSAKVFFYGGLYMAAGSLWFDDVTCAPLPKEERINAHYGKPEDGLTIAPDQLALFSPDQTFQGESVVMSDESPVPLRWQLEEKVSGYEATAQTQANARWKPVLEVRDAWGRFSGVAGALVDHYQGPFYRSRWALFGVNDRDLFDSAGGVRLLQAIVHTLRSGVYAQTLESDNPIYAPGETAHVKTVLHNTSRQAQTVEVELTYLAPEEDGTRARVASATQAMTLPVRSSENLFFDRAIQENWPDFVILDAAIKTEGTLVDRIRSGFCVRRETVMASGPRLRYRDNSFELTSPDGNTRRVALWGTDTYGNYFFSPSHSPLTWFNEIGLMRDNGLHLFENLQWIPPKGQNTAKQWKQLDSFIQLTQRFGLPYMAGIWIGQDVAVSDADLQIQADYCRRFAARYKNVPGLIYYLNGDFQLRLKDQPDLQRLWNEFLQERYGSDEELKKAWSLALPEAPLGQIPVRTHPAQAWYDIRAKDTTEFETRLMRRWIDALCKAIRQEDSEHPITSEYYQRPFSGIDLRLTLSGMDAANIGYFDKPEVDLARLAAVVKWNDMRRYGKTVNLGEFGVKTHEAWAVERGGSHYHIQRSEADMRRLFWNVAHTALGMGVSKIQNWCWSDDPDRVFPWGIAWNNPLRAKPSAKMFRNLRLLSERLPLEYKPAEVVFVMPDSWRMGAPESLAHTSLLNALECMLATNVPFDVVNQNDLSMLKEKTPRLIVAPLAYAYPEAAIQALMDLASSGSHVYLSGDPGINEQGQRDHSRLERLCGVKWTGSSAHASGLPFAQVEVSGASDVSMGAWKVYRLTLGQGSITYIPEPWETFPDRDLFAASPELTSSKDSNYYLHLMEQTGIQPAVIVESDSGVWRATVNDNAAGTGYFLYPRMKCIEGTTVRLNTAQGALHFGMKEAIPGMAMFDKNGVLTSATGSSSLAMDDQLLIQGESPWMLLTLDRRPPQQSQALVLCTMGGGRVWWKSEAGRLAAAPVEWRQGKAVLIGGAEVPARDRGLAVKTEACELYLIAPAEQLARRLQDLQNQFEGKTVASGVE